MVRVLTSVLLALMVGMISGGWVAVAMRDAMSRIF